LEKRKENKVKMRGNAEKGSRVAATGPRRTLHEHAGAFGKSTSTDGHGSFLRRPERVLTGEEDERWMCPCDLYRYFTDEGVLLYVGISIQPWLRHQQHVAQPWFTDAAYRSIETFPCGDIAAWAERVVIERENPEFNALRKYAEEKPGRRFWWYTDLTGGAAVGVGPRWGKLDWGTGWPNVDVIDCEDPCLPPHKFRGMAEEMQLRLARQAVAKMNAARVKL
jgi:hypothetical protein